MPDNRCQRCGSVHVSPLCPLEGQRLATRLTAQGGANFHGNAAAQQAQLAPAYQGLQAWVPRDELQPAQRLAALGRELLLLLGEGLALCGELLRLLVQMVDARVLDGAEREMKLADECGTLQHQRDEALLRVGQLELELRRLRKP